MEASVRLLCLNKVGVHTHLRAEHFVKWLWEAYLAEGASAPPNQEWWQKLVGLTQCMWQHGYIPTDMGWTVLFLAPKINTDTHVIGLMETLWEVVEEIVYIHLRESTSFHNVLRGLCAGR